MYHAAIYSFLKTYTRLGPDLVFLIEDPEKWDPVFTEPGTKNQFFEDHFYPHSNLRVEEVGQTSDLSSLLPY